MDWSGNIAAVPVPIGEGVQQMEPLTIQRDVVKHGVRLGCLIEGSAYSAEREEVRSQRLAGVECVEIAEKTGLPIEQVIDYCRELGLPEVEKAVLHGRHWNRSR